MKILSLDGGGVRGAFSVRLLQRLEALHPFLADIDLFAGTSTGGIIALGLAAGISLDRILDLYMQDAAQIFDADLPQRLASLGELTGPKYGSDGRYRALVKVFSTRTMDQLERDVIVTAFDCAAREPILFTRANRFRQVVFAAMATSAAEVYFAPWGTLVDGGTWANNPAMAALAWALGHDIPLDEIQILSLGTGNAHPPPIEPGLWGGVQWLSNGLIDLLIEAPVKAADEQCRVILRGRYLRLDGDVDCAMDETQDLERRLIQPADATDLSSAVQWLRANQESSQESA